ncbi:2,3,4,5-tetrahydropyridine-2,6-dicarboxylate N-succinyltransferase [Pseudomonadales bacterium]|jgi:2,3,4,5-tetrahydropyridine-2-carboxylate N-succinyltransferase|nr:2,3,4,5-tetrahydropyridine-2,6-dicarboxylate N-succinyltransferase [Pseudomonadales bacterium]MDB2542756.1 2,3,4,5-tetrahydropyridine-2,6-dicarboxylate N-succinyltransferase [Pseudomonadales bacterium]MDG1302849.1 DapH/DapD/GlmU-related protein [Pseudomonadales bacterium]MDG1834941.1 DapH/DapD/GlmU-related protein [Pseudomonadales bacterium]|tara:strand:+ start:2851 stop:3882 length:1032 start_codon:yes stop_codon:yes gene_type:complete
MTSSQFTSLAFGIGTQNKHSEWLEVFYPTPVYQPSKDLVDAIKSVTGYQSGNEAIELDAAMLTELGDAISDDIQSTLVKKLAKSSQPTVLMMMATDSEIASIPEAYLKLHLLSYRYVKPNEQNLVGIFSKLPNVAWTSDGAIDPAELEEAILKARIEGRHIEVASVDKFPKLTNYVLPTGVRIAHTARVRLGAYLGEGTTVMHEGFVNFNAGSIGPNMIEGRVSQGVLMREGSDLGGGASTMGTLSGGGEMVLTIGKDCLIGANAGAGIPLGDRCTIEAGTYITAGTLVQVFDENKKFIKLVKARELAGQSDMLFIRHSQTGAIECRTNQKAIKLNDALHDHN